MARPLGTYMARSPARSTCRCATSTRPDGIVELEVDAISGMLPGPLTRTTVTEVFEQLQPAEPEETPPAFQIEAETGKIWQEGCGDKVEGSGGPRAAAYLDLAEYEEEHPTWEAANATGSRRGAVARTAAPRPGAAARGRACAHRALHARRGADLHASPSPSTPTPRRPEATVEPTLVPTPTPGPPTPTPRRPPRLPSRG